MMMMMMISTQMAPNNSFENCFYHQFYFFFVFNVFCHHNHHNNHHQQKKVKKKFNLTALHTCQTIIIFFFFFLVDDIFIFPIYSHYYMHLNIYNHQWKKLLRLLIGFNNFDSWIKKNVIKLKCCLRRFHGYIFFLFVHYLFVYSILENVYILCEKLEKFNFINWYYIGRNFYK